MPARHCIAVGCTADIRTSISNVRFFQLPKVDSELRKWLRLVRREGFNVDTKYDTQHQGHVIKAIHRRQTNTRKPLSTLFDYNNYKTTTTPRETNNSNRRNRKPQEQQCSVITKYTV
jgi:hypothetical protein